MDVALGDGPFEEVTDEDFRDFILATVDFLEEEVRLHSLFRNPPNAFVDSVEVRSLCGGEDR